MRILALKLILIICGTAAGIIQTCVSIPQLSLVVYVPMFYSVIYDKKILNGKFSWLKSWHVCIFFMQLTSCSFLVTIYKLMPLPAAIGIILSIAALLALSLWLTLLTSIPISFLEKIRCGRIWDVYSFCILYTIGEWLCENVFVLSFPWSTVSLSAVSWQEMIQSSSLMGGKLTSLIILAVNGLIAYAFSRKNIRTRLSYMICAVSVVSITVFYGANHILYLKNLTAESGENLNVMIAQDNVEGKEKSKLKGSEAAEHYLSVISENWSDNTDFILLPETAIPKNFDEQAEEFSGLMSLAKEKSVIICSGAFCENSGKTYNALYVITPDGAGERPYYKQILVPFGERIPFAGILGLSTVSCCDDEEYTQPIETDDYEIGCGICIESIYPSIFREQAEQGGKFFVIPTNDSWFGRSFARYAHYRHSILRSVENQRYTLRSGNCGISAVITPWGEESSAIKSSDRAVIADSIKMLEAESVYTQTGDGLFISLCILYLTIRFFISTTSLKI